MLPTILVLLAATGAQPNLSCARYIVAPGPDQGASDAALVTAATHRQTGPRDLGTVLAGNGWRVICAAPADS